MTGIRRGRALIEVVRVARAAAAAATIALLLVTVISGALPVLVAWLTKDLVDLLAGVAQGARLGGASFMVTGGALIAAVLLARVLPPIDQWFSAELERRLRQDIQRRLSAKIVAFRGLAVFEDPQFHNDIQLAQEGGMTAPVQLVALLAAFVQQGVTLTGFVIALVGVEPWLVVLFMLAALPGLFGELRLSRIRVRLAYELSPAERRRMFYNMLQIDLRAIKEIRLFGLGAYFHDRMLRELAAIDRAERRMDARGARLHLVLAVAAGVVTVVALIYLLRAAAVGAVTVGEATLAIAALGGLQEASAGMVRSTAQLSAALQFFGYYERFVARPGDMDDGAAAPVPRLRSAITLEDVWFRYTADGPWVLRGVNLEIPIRHSVALVGPNGAGKSTVVKLLCRLYDPQRGVIRWDGIDVRQLDIDELRAAMTAVFQDAMEYELTAADNIGLGDLRHIGDTEHIAAAARRAGVHDDVVQLPAGYDTLLTRIYADGPESVVHDGSSTADAPALVGSGGVALSGGQWQKIAIARMLLRDDAQLAVLDEPSHELDVDAEHEMLQLFDTVASTRSVVLVTHRLNTVRLADRIYVLGAGRVIESGSHDELLRRCGTYARMFSRQAQAYR
jgi:ATP-binding cassette subfamily B protein